MKDFTIIAVETSEMRCITEHIKAKDIAQATKIFAREHDSPDTTEIIDIFEGELISLMPSGFPIPCSELI